ncbi:UNKNOWN [Stylonychia lemnae]|uniref:Uncharacterized protein n=1 Tax=Stylonychia lemnae TaxID=5949 RepID=A0A077ZYX1_STYLE|nr:UNKNOWN [Stylonychia lemnae]|eukprot:CDW73738.1 UNKNOWN [Stylonychia lemnae]
MNSFFSWRGINEIEIQTYKENKRIRQLQNEQKSTIREFTENLIKIHSTKGFVQCREKQQYLHFEEFMQVDKLQNNHIEKGYDVQKFYLVSFKSTSIAIVSEIARQMTVQKLNWIFELKQLFCVKTLIKPINSRQQLLIDQNWPKGVNLFLVGGQKGLYMFEIEPKKHKINLVCQALLDESVVGIEIFNEILGLFLILTKQYIKIVKIIDREFVEIASSYEPLEFIQVKKLYQKHQYLLLNSQGIILYKIKHHKTQSTLSVKRIRVILVQSLDNLQTQAKFTGILNFVKDETNLELVSKEIS